MPLWAGFKNFLIV